MHLHVNRSSGWKGTWGCYTHDRDDLEYLDENKPVCGNISILSVDRNSSRGTALSILNEVVGLRFDRRQQRKHNDFKEMLAMLQAL